MRNLGVECTYKHSSRKKSFFILIFTKSLSIIPHYWLILVLPWLMLWLLPQQMVAYLSLATTAAATEASFLAVTGANTFQWSKLCTKFTRFCHQIGGGLLCAITASLLMAAIASISAFYLFRLYSPKRFFSLKPHLR